jgi:large subunit ribosomal protein L25
MMQVIKLAIEPRTETGKGAARKLRREGRVPAVLYRDGNEPVMFSFDPEEFEYALRRGANRNSLFELNVDGTPRLCLIKEFQRHPVTRRVRHMDFYEVVADKPVVVKVRVMPQGRAEGTKLGGQLNVLRRTLDVRCLPAYIPASIDVNVTPLKVGDFIRVASIVAPEQTEILFESNFNVISVVGKRLETDDMDDEEGEGEAAEADAPAEA